MNISVLNKKYKNCELSSLQGDAQLKYEVLSPLFANLYENKAVYHEHDTCIIRLENIIITPDYFEATAVIIKMFEPLSISGKRLAESNSWTIGASWAALKFNNKGRLSTYSGWLMWIDPELVKKVEGLVNKNNFDEAWNMTMGNL